MHLKYEVFYYIPLPLQISVCMMFFSLFQEFAYYCFLSLSH